MRNTIDYLPNPLHIVRCGIKLGWLAVLLALVACESDNEHFCARYHYVYSQLLDEKELPSYVEMRQQLILESRDPKKNQDQARFMLFVLEDWHLEIKPDGESPREFCMRFQRWNAYQPVTK